MFEQPPSKCPLCLHVDSHCQPVDKIHMWSYSCPRCGTYFISSLLYQKQFRHSPDSIQFKLACIAYEYHWEHGYDYRAPFVLTDDGLLPYSAASAFPGCRVFTPEQMERAFPNGIEIADRALLNLSRRVRHPMDIIEPTQEDLPFMLFSEKDNLSRLTEYMKEMGVIRDALTTNDQVRLTITPAGWSRVQELSEISNKSRKAFVAMWFAEEMDAVYQEGIAPAIIDAGFEPTRIDAIEHNNKICDEMIAEIRQSRFVIADFTGQRGGVYFEAGFGLGIGLPVIWLVRKDHLDGLHFDTEHYNHIVYETPHDLREKLHNRIAATIEFVDAE